MQGNVLETWCSYNANNEDFLVIPDGCRDLIFSQQKSSMPQWHISPLFDQSTMITTSAKTNLCGFRLRAGIRIDEQALLDSFANAAITDSITREDVYSRLQDFTRFDACVAEAMECFSLGYFSVQESANQLGLKQRTLQRLMLRETGRTPKYWMMLARARKAARFLYYSKSVTDADIANEYNYADQAHLCRDIKRWFGVTPTVLHSSLAIGQQLNDRAYC